MRIHQMKTAIVLLLITSAFAASVVASAFSKAGSKPPQLPFQPQAATKITTVTANQEQGQSPPQSIAEVISELQRINPNATASRDVEINPVTQQLLTALKHQLRGLVVDVLKTPAAQQEPVSSLKQRTVKRLAQQGVTVAPPPFSEYYRPEEDSIICYGYIDEIEFKRPAEHPDLLAVTAALAINCGEDTSLYLFRKSLVGYRLILALEANGYEDISGAQSSFDYSISPPDKDGNFFIVAADVNAWCTSRWQTLRYKALRIGTTPEEPQVIAQAEHGILIDKEPVFNLTTTADGFKFTFWHEQSLDLGIQERRHVLNYSLQGNTVKRIAPLALRPEDFLDEWIKLPWDEAAQWAEASKLTELRTWHERFQSGDERCCSELDSVRPYPSLPKRWQVAVTTDDERADKLPPQLFFKISRKGNAFFIEDISTTEDNACTGRDRLHR